MIVRDFHEANKTDRKVANERWESVRLLLADDGMGFSFHITTIEGGSEHTFHYKNHFESVYCISGKGSIEDLATGTVHQIRPGVMYALDKHDKHTLRCEDTMVLACCFNPPVTGTEVHRADGSYAAAD
ncbi:ectoine synthase [Rhodobaculum claviforme]|uniref:L-ectoine synthase n=1 Tax=Rhodobaculum claviforme TaxID=1549854 RepID=A0A934TLG4_9RHOB|nr:ectoine synthase [Rhodobaculum claviforme]MBK5927198.1 L-ectoine synthase [Rhodobaculum claviforme]